MTNSMHSQNPMDVSPEMASEFLERHIDAYSGGGDNGPDYDDLDDDERYGFQRYSVGFRDGFAYAVSIMNPVQIARTRIENRVKRWRYALHWRIIRLKERLFPSENDGIPF